MKKHINIFLFLILLLHISYINCSKNPQAPDLREYINFIRNADTLNFIAIVADKGITVDSVKNVYLKANYPFDWSDKYLKSNKIEMGFCAFRISFIKVDNNKFEFTTSAFNTYVSRHYFEFTDSSLVLQEYINNELKETIDLKYKFKLGEKGKYVSYDTIETLYFGEHAIKNCLKLSFTLEDTPYVLWLHPKKGIIQYYSIIRGSVNMVILNKEDLFMEI